MTVKITTDRLTLRPVSLLDAEALFAYRSDPVLNQYQGSIAKSIDDTVEFIEKTAVEFNVNDSWYQLVIIENLSKHIIGDVGIHFIGSENLQAEVGCTLNSRYHGQGYATEALRGVIDYLFNHLHKHRIIASIDPGNIPSLKMVEKLNFRKEAHFKQSLFLHGQWVDDVIYAVLKSEWKTN